MTVDQIKALVDKVGKDKIAALYFDNNRTFKRNPSLKFDDEVKFNPTMGYIEIRYQQINGTPFTQIEFADSMLALTVMDKPEDVIRFDKSV